MVRFARVHSKRVHAVSSSPVTGFVAVPDTLSHLSDVELMQKVRLHNDRLVEYKTVFESPEKLKVACVSVHGIACGISTYSEWLWSEMRKAVGELTVFAERSEGAAEEPGVVRCWKRGESLTELARRLRAYEPDVVFIQHEYGLFPQARYFLSLLSQLHGFRVVTVLHSVYSHLDKLIVEAALPEIIVHTETAAKYLREVKKVPGKVSVVPHGTHAPAPGRLWNLYGSKHTVVQFGFGFRYKSFENVIEAVAKLKPKYPDIFFTALFSESAHAKAELDGYHGELQDLVQRKGLADHVAIIRGFQSDESLNSYLRTNRIAVFPYKDNGEHTVMGCSGAAVLAMSTGMPVVVSKVPLFDNLEGVCPRVSTVSDLAVQIERLFKDENCASQVNRQDEYLRKCSWPNVAKLYLETLK